MVPQRYGTRWDRLLKSVFEIAPVISGKPAVAALINDFYARWLDVPLFFLTPSFLFFHPPVFYFHAQSSLAGSVSVPREVFCGNFRDAETSRVNAEHVLREK